MAMKMMEEEMPNTHLGVLLFMWLKLVCSLLCVYACVRVCVVCVCACVWVWVRVWVGVCMRLLDYLIVPACGGGGVGLTFI